MKIFLIATLVMSLLLLSWHGLTQVLPNPAITYTLILLIAPICAVVLALSSKKRWTAKDKTETRSMVGMPYFD